MNFSLVLYFAYCIQQKALNMNASISEFQEIEIVLLLSAFGLKEEF